MEMTGCSGAGMDSGKEEASLGKKYGGIVPKKPLISKDNGRAFFDSADWALEMQGSDSGQRTRTAMESLRPKLQPTPHQQLPPRRPTCTTGNDRRLGSSCEEHTGQSSTDEQEIPTFGHFYL